MGEHNKITKRSLLLTLLTISVAIYLPFVWLFFEPQTSIGGNHFLFFFVAPVLVPTGLLGMAIGWLSGNIGEVPFDCLGVTLTITLIASFVYWGRNGGTDRIIATACASVTSALLSAMTYFLFLAAGC